MPRALLSLTASALVCATALAGCAAVGPNYTPPAPLTSASDYRAPGEGHGSIALPTAGAALAQDWWTVFPSPELDQTIRQAIAGNPELSGAEASLRAAREQMSIDDRGNYPLATGEGSVTSNRLNLSSFGFSGGPFPQNPEFDLYSVGAKVSFPMDVFGGVRRQAESSRAKAQTALYQRDAAWLSLTGQVAGQAARLAALKAEIKVVRSIIADDHTTLKLVELAVRAGGEPRRAGVSASAQLAADATLLPPLLQQQDAARHALAALVGKSPADWTAPDFDLSRMPVPDTIPVVIPSELVHQRPDILAAEARYRGAIADVGVLVSKLYPSFELKAELTQSSLGLGDIFNAGSSAFNIGPKINLPLFSGGRGFAAVRGVNDQARMAEASYQTTVLRAFTQVADMMSALEHDQQSLSAQQHALELAEESARLAKVAYGAGGTGLFPIIDASRQVNSARLGVVRAEAQLRLDAIQLFVATGRGLAKAK
jgi:NodT family efflux transporter outer membrane factor (OMF) lipoprotein